MYEIKRGKPQQWTDEQLQKIALEVKYKLPNAKLTALQLEKETGIGRNTWSRRMKGFINQLNAPVHVPSLKEGGIITIATVDELFENYGDNTIELKNEIAKLLNIINDLYNDAKQVEALKANVTKLQTELDTTKEKLKQSAEQKVHFEVLYNQIVAESYFPHLYGCSEKLQAANVKAKIIPLPQSPNEILNITEPLKIYNANLKENLIKDGEENDLIKKLNNKFNLDF
ncbi:hypothetical protein [Solibacillus sp. FSL K6-1126]|uniref:hypothetical protein n=1 Tax=Solibacillus sp. FSL K6-1126 TaxID=2921463 RepID=UPI0030F63573